MSMPAAGGCATLLGLGPRNPHRGNRCRELDLCRLTVSCQPVNDPAYDRTTSCMSNSSLRVCFAPTLRQKSFSL